MVFLQRNIFLVEVCNQVIAIQVSTFVCKEKYIQNHVNTQDLFFSNEFR